MGPLCLVGVLLLGTSALAQQTARHEDDRREREATREESKELLSGVARLVDQSAEGLTAVSNTTTGTVSVDLDDRFQHVSLAKLGSDGKPAVRCISSTAEAAQFLGAPAAKAKVAARTTAKAPAQRARPVASAPLEEK
jgi:hypothetical protein